MTQVRGGITERINGERLSVLGWSRAILMQIAHPLVAAGIEAHSTFRQTPLAWTRRLNDTVKAMLALTFGTPEEHQRAVGRIRAIHDRVNGTLSEPHGSFPSGTTYSAHDAELLLWVHATLLDSIPLAYEYFVGPLTRQEKDEYCATASEAMVDLGVPAARAPHTIADLHTYLARMEEARILAGTDTSRALVTNVLFPTLGWAAGPAAWLQRAFTIGTLPPPIREIHGFAWSAERAAALERWSARVRRLRARTPDALARWSIARR